MNMSRGSMLVWLTVIAFIFTLAPPSMPSISPENGPQVKGDGGNGQNDAGKQDGTNVVVETLSGNTNPPVDGGDGINDDRKQDDSKVVDPVNPKPKDPQKPGWGKTLTKPARSFGTFLRDLYKMDMSKGSLEKKLDLANNLTDKSQKGLAEYKAALTKAISAKEDLENTQATKKKGATPDEKKNFKNLVKANQKKANAAVQEVHKAEGNMRSWYNSMIRPGVGYGVPVAAVFGGLLVGNKLLSGSGDPQPTDPPEVTYQHPTFEAARVPQVPSAPEEDDPLVLVLIIGGIVLLAIVVIVVAIMMARRFGLFDSAASSSNSSDKQHHKGGPPPSGHKADKKDEKKPIPKGTGKVYPNNTATTAKPAVVGELKKEVASKRPKSWPISGGPTGGNGGAKSDTTRSGSSCTDLSATANHYTTPATNTNTSDGQKPKVKALVDYYNQNK